MSDKNTPQKTETPPNMGPGERLQAARISIGMTIDDVANKMHLSSEILNSLEENNFDDITAPIFVKGYLRAYARLVKMDENEIIDQYTHYYTDGDPPISSIRNTMPEINADDARVKWTTYLVIFVLITLLFMWWWNRYQQPTETLSLETESMNTSGSLKLPSQKVEMSDIDSSEPVALPESGPLNTDTAEPLSPVADSEDTMMPAQSIESSMQENSAEMEPVEPVVKNPIRRSRRWLLLKLLRILQL